MNHLIEFNRTEALHTSLTRYLLIVILDSEDDGVCLHFDQVFQVILMNGNAMNQTEHAQNAGVEKSGKVHASCVEWSLTLQQRSKTCWNKRSIMLNIYSNVLT